jgi:hypothetical protein
MSTAHDTMKRRSVRAGADMKHAMSALAVARQVDLDAEDRIGVAKHC